MHLRLAGEEEQNMSDERQWVTVKSDGPEWLRSVANAADGAIFVPAVVSLESEMAVSLGASVDGNLPIILS
jgi:hypothetical protein